MADSMTGAGDWNGQLARFAYLVKADAERQRGLDLEEEDALELLVRALVCAGPLRKPRSGTFEQWVAVLERLRELGYVRGSGAWYHPTLAGVRRGLLLIRERQEPVTSFETLRAAAGVVKGEPADAVADTERLLDDLDLSPGSESERDWGPAQSCGMLTGHTGSDPTPDVACGRRATFVHGRDRTHFVCALCYTLMGEDAELQAEYVPYHSKGDE